MLSTWGITNPYWIDVIRAVEITLIVLIVVFIIFKCANLFLKKKIVGKREKGV